MASPVALIIKNHGADKTLTIDDRYPFKVTISMRALLIRLSTYSLLFSVMACSHESATTTGFWQEMQADVSINDGPPRSGEEVYEYRCKSCHERNTQGAPMPGDEYEWRRRAAKGMSVLMEHTINGYQRTLMPARGGCLNCSDDELRNALVYMLETSNIDINRLND